MARGFEHAGRAYEVTARPRARGGRVDLDFHAARRLLAVPMRDGTRMRELRWLLGAEWSTHAVSRMTDAEVVEHLAARIATRRLHVYADPIRRTLYRIDVERVEEVLGPLSQTEVEEPVDESLDVPAQVAAMQRAAQDGLPFCEECEKARLAAAAEAQAPAPDPYEDVDVPAQAAAMRDAADKGVPFCEECEKARLAAAAEPAQAPAKDPWQDTDVAAQAATMHTAANDGAPFCEECEKARLAAQAEQSGTQGG